MEIEISIKLSVLDKERLSNPKEPYNVITNPLKEEVDKDL
jgi:hypothetical protein